MVMFSSLEISWAGTCGQCCWVMWRLGSPTSGKQNGIVDPLTFFSTGACSVDRNVPSEIMLAFGSLSLSPLSLCNYVHVRECVLIYALV